MILAKLILERLTKPVPERPAKLILERLTKLTIGRPAKPVTERPAKLILERPALALDTSALEDSACRQWG